MRCLVVADLHYSLPQFDWLLAAAPEFDLVIFAGDALDVGSLVDFRAQIVVVKKYLALLSGITKVILCSGNHDLDERSAEGEKVARSDTFEWLSRAGFVARGLIYTIIGVLAVKVAIGVRSVSSPPPR